MTEILLAKTRAELVDNVAKRVLDAYPDVRHLARAKVSDLEAMLFPLGLHRKRALGLVRCACMIVEDLEGRIPDSIEGLMELPTIGRYAAHAIACVVYGARVAVLDANVSRIYQRYFSLPKPPPRLATAHEMWSVAERVLPARQAKLFNWAILDLGGTVCTAKSPHCDRCPLLVDCDRHGLPKLPRV